MNFTGILTIIDNNGDGECECVWIDHVSSVIKVAANSNGKLKDKTTGNIFDTTAEGTGIFINGKPGFADQLSIGDILYVYESSTTGKNKITRFTRNSSLISGTVTEKTTDGKVKINDEKYKISSACDESINVGLQGVFYIDDFSNVIGYEEETVSLNIGAFLGINLKNSLDFDMEVKLLTDSGIQIFEVSKNIKYDGYVVKTEEDLYNGTQYYAGVKDLTVKTPVLYKTNAAGELKMIDTVNSGTDDEDDSLTKLSDAQSFRYLGSVLVNSSWQNCYPATKDVVVLKMTTENNEDYYSVQKGFTDRETFTNNVTPYTIEKDSIIADVLVVMDHPAEVNYPAPAFVFDDIKVAINDEGDTARYIHGYTSDGKVKYEINEESYSSDENFKKLVDSVKKGDLIYPYLTKGKVVSCDLMYTPGALSQNSAGVPSKIYDGIASADGALRYGTVTKLEDGFIQFELQGNGRLDSYTSSGKVLVCEKQPNGEYKIANELPPSAIFEGDRIIVRISEYVVKAVYIYRGDRS